MRFKLRHENPFGPLFSPCCTVFILTFCPQFGQNRRPVPICRYSGNCGHLICTREIHCKSEASDDGLITIKQIINAKNEEPYLFSKLAPFFFAIMKKLNEKLKKEVSLEVFSHQK
jgi:hypothetical protein